jgi:predicted  nucleic acid-binding Zn-ribbon protein
MQALSLRKRLAVIQHVLRGDSYDVTATRTGVSKGGVAGVIADLKAGLIPEVQEPAELIDLLREVAVECRKANITPERAMIGLIVLSRLQELQIEPAEIDRWAAVYRQLGQDAATIQAFIRTALLVEEVRGHFGLTIEGLEARVQALQKELARLEPTAKELRQCEKSLQDLQKREKAAAVEIVQLEKRRDELRVEVAGKEKRETELARRVEVLEKRAHAAEGKLAAARNGLALLEKLGLSPEGLSGFAQRVDGIAQRHGMKPEALRDRLLSELEKLDESLTLDVLMETRRTEHAKIEQDLVQAKDETIAEKAALKELRQQKARVGNVMQQELFRVREELNSITKTARDATEEISQGLSTDMANASAEIVKLTNMAIELGRDFGRYEGIANANEWARVFSALMTGKGDITASQLRVAGLTVLRAVNDWPKRSGAQGPLLAELVASLGSAIREMEKWRP